MSQKLSVRNFKWIEKDEVSKFDEKFIKNYDENSDKGYILEVDVEYPENIRMLHSDLAFLPERMKINKCTKLVCTIHNKENYVVHIRALKQTLNHGLKLTKVQRIIQFDQEAWRKPYIDMNTELRKHAKNDFEKDFFKLMNNSVFGKTMENVRNHRDIKLVTSDKRRRTLASEPNYHSSKRISKDLMIIEMRKVEVKMNNRYISVKQYWILANHLRMNFGMIILSLNMEIRQGYTIWIRIALLFILKQKIFTKILQATLKDGLIHQIMMKRIKDLFQ